MTTKLKINKISPYGRDYSVVYFNDGSSCKVPKGLVFNNLLDVKLVSKDLKRRLSTVKLPDGREVVVDDRELIS